MLTEVVFFKITFIWGDDKDLVVYVFVDEKEGEKINFAKAENKFYSYFEDIDKNVFIQNIERLGYGI
jgi:hypothetical protein